MKINLKELKREYKAEHDYLKEYFEFNIQKIEERRKIILKKAEEDKRNHPDIYIHMDHMIYLELVKIPSYFYHSSLVTLFSYFEKYLNQICNLISEKTEFPFYLKDISESNTMKKVKKFLEGLTDIDFTEINDLWSKITMYQRLRNIIVHHSPHIFNPEEKKKIYPLIKLAEIDIDENDGVFYIKNSRVLFDLLSLFNDFIGFIFEEIEGSDFEEFMPAFLPNDDLPF